MRCLKLFPGSAVFLRPSEFHTHVVHTIPNEIASTTSGIQRLGQGGFCLSAMRRAKSVEVTAEVIELLNRGVKQPQGGCDCLDVELVDS